MNLDDYSIKTAKLREATQKSQNRISKETCNRRKMGCDRWECWATWVEIISALLKKGNKSNGNAEGTVQGPHHDSMKWQLSVLALS